MIFRPVFHLALLGIIAVFRRALHVSVRPSAPPRRHVWTSPSFLIVVWSHHPSGAGPSIPGRPRSDLDSGLLRHRPHRFHGRRGLGRQQSP